MLAFLINQIFKYLLRLLMQLHNVVLDQIHVILNWLLLLLGHFYVFLSSAQRLLQHHQLWWYFLFLLQKLIPLCLQWRFDFCNVITLGSKLLCKLLLFSDLCSDSRNLTFKQNILLVLVLYSFPQCLDCRVFFLH